MTNHSVPSAPKASRRGQVRATPPLKPQRQWRQDKQYR